MDRETSEILGWLIFVFRVLVLVGALGTVLALVRRASSRAAYLLAASVGLQLASMCCWRATNLAFREEFSETYRYAMFANTCVGLLVDAASVGLVVYAFAVLARALTARPNANP